MTDKFNETTLVLALARERKYVKEEVLNDCLLEVEMTEKSLTQIMVEKGLIEPKVQKELALAIKFALSQDRNIQEDIMFLELLLESELVSNRELEIARHQQRKAQQAGETPSVREVLLQLGLITDEQVAQVVNMMNKLELLCEKCDQRFAWETFAPGEPVKCKSCEFLLLPASHHLSQTHAHTLNLGGSSSTAVASPASNPDDTVVEGGSVGDDTVVEKDKDTNYEGGATHTMIDSGVGTRPRTKSQTVTNDPFIGKTLGDTKLTKKLGQGGMGAVYLGENFTLARTEAVKILTGDATEEEQVIRFKREARAAGTLDSPHIVRVYSIGEDKGVNYICMEFVKGQSIQDLIEEQAQVPVLDALNYIKQAAKGLAAAHAKEIVHRDIKPDNLLLGETGIVKVADFGLARKTQDTMGVTQTGSIMGTPYYMSPEQCQGEVTDGRSDIYSLGATLYYMVTGEHPFTGESPMAILLKHMHSDLTPAHEVNPNVPVSLSNVIEKMMEKKAEYRYANLDEFIEDVTKVEEGEDIGISEGKRIRLFKKRLKIAASVVVAVALILFFSLYEFESEGARKEREAKKQLQEGKSLIEAGDLNAAAKKLEDARKNNPTSEVLDSLADVKIRLGTQALEKAEKLVDKLAIAADREEFLKNTTKALKNWNEAKEYNSLAEETYQDYRKRLYALYFSLGVFWVGQRNLEGGQKNYQIAEQVFSQEEVTKELQYVATIILLQQSIQKLETGSDDLHAQEPLKSIQNLVGGKDLLRKKDPKKLSEAQDILSKILFREGKSIRQEKEKAQFLNQSIKAEFARVKTVEDMKKSIQLVQSEWKGKLKLLNTLGKTVVNNVNALKSRQQKPSLNSSIPLDLQKLKKLKSDRDSAVGERPDGWSKLTAIDAKELEQIYTGFFVPLESQLNNSYELYKNKAQMIRQYSSSFRSNRETEVFFQGKQKSNSLTPKDLNLAKNRWEKVLVDLKEVRSIAEISASDFVPTVKGLEKEVALNLYRCVLVEANRLKESDKKKARSLFKRALQVIQKYNPEEYQAITNQAAELLAQLNTPDKMVYVHGGEYTVGSTNRNMNNPERKVRLDSYYMGITEVTRQEYHEFIRAGGYQKKKYWKAGGWNLFHGKKKRYHPWPQGWKNDKIQHGSKANHPVTGICFYEAAAYAAWKAEKVHGTRLPSAVEWEVAASYGPPTSGNQPRVRTRYPWGDQFNSSSFGQFYNREMPGRVGAFFTRDKSRYNCLDMASNVSEWVIVSPGSSQSGGIRGGSFDTTFPRLQADVRFGGFSPAPEDRLEDVGFRLCVETKYWKKP